VVTAVARRHDVHPNLLHHWRRQAKRALEGGQGFLPVAAMPSARPKAEGATYAREGIELDVSTLADWVGASAVTLMPLVEAVRAHVFEAGRLHADDTTVPVLDVGRTRTGRLWTYVRDDRPFGGAGPPAAAYFYSPDRRGEHPEAHLASWAGLMQADAYAGYDRLCDAGRRPGPIVEGACWAHARRKFFDLARLNKAPIAIEAIARIVADPQLVELRWIVRQFGSSWR
jgi:transposase